MVPLVLTAMLLSAAPSTEDVRVAVVVGSNVGNAGEDVLGYAEQDAERFHRLLIDVGGVRPERAFLVTSGGAPAVRQAMAEAKGRLAELGKQAPNAFILYVSGHADADALHLEGTQLPLAELRQTIDGFEATFRLVVIDACRTPVRAVSKGGRPAPEVAVVAPELAQVKGLVWISSAGEGEPAQEWATLSGSLFSHHVMSALRGAADFNRDGAVSLAETYAYAFSRTVSQAVLSNAGVQRPSFEMQLAGWGDWVFARPAQLGATLVFDESLGGTLWVLDRRQVLIAEVSKSRGEMVRLAVAPGAYRVVQREGAFVKVAEVNLFFGAERSVADFDWVRQRARDVLRKGRAWASLRPWQFSVGYGLSSHYLDGAGLQHWGELSLRRTWGSLFARLKVGGTQSQFLATESRVTHQEVRVALAAGWQWPAWNVLFSLGVEPQAAFAQQWVQRDSREQIQRVFGVSEPRRTATAWGGAAVVQADLPFSERWVVSAELSGAVLGFSRWDGTIAWRFVPRGAVSLGLRF